MNRLTTLLLTFTIIGLALPAMAVSCRPTTSVADVTTSDGYYLVQDECGSRCLLSIWVYEESNGIEGLQRGDKTQDDTCAGLIEPDELVI